jgi:hypothetical protein
MRKPPPAPTLRRAPPPYHRRPAHPQPPAWKPYVHPHARGLVMSTGQQALADALARFGFKAEFATEVNGYGTPLPNTLRLWIPAEAQETAELLFIFNRALKVGDVAAAAVLQGLQGLPAWPDTMAELRACHRLGADNDTLRSIIAQLTAKGDP